MNPIRPQEDVLLVIDVQVDFCPGGALAVANGDAVVSPINRLLQVFPHAIATQDWHSADHSSFAISHAGAAAFDVIDTPYGRQTLWPRHCVQGTSGAGFHPALDTDRVELIVRKGFRSAVDSYSAFFENDKTTPTGLAGYLRARGFRRVFVAGLATDYCVSHSALDAAQLGFDTTVFIDACQAIDLGGSLAAAQKEWKKAGVTTARSEAF